MIPQRIAHFELKELLGQGRSGDVYQAFDTRLNRAVALKVFRQDPDSPGFPEEVAVEARRLASLQHPNLPTVYEYGEEEAQGYMAMELVTGRTILQRLTTDPFSLKEAVKVGVQIAAALQVIHERGLIHGDLSDTNIMLTNTGEVKLLDFGLTRRVKPIQEMPTTNNNAKESPCPPNREEVFTTGFLSRPGWAIAEDQGHLRTEEENIKNEAHPPGLHPFTQSISPIRLAGTSAYISPEQLRTGTSDARNDIFALGVLLYEMITGNNPFAHPNPVDVFRLVLHHEPPPMGQYQEEVPLELERVVRRALAKDPAQRYPGAGEVAADLRHVDQLLQDRSAGLETGPTDEITADITSPAKPLPVVNRQVRFWTKIRYLRTPLLAVGFGALALAVTIMLFPLPGYLEWAGNAVLLVVAGFCFLTVALSRYRSPLELHLTQGNAFRGLLSFGERDRNWFFGRGSERERLLTIVMEADLPFGVLVGESGCGKTSLLRAGLIPRLWEEGCLPLYCRSFPDPVAAIMAEAHRHSQIELRAGEPPSEYLRRVSEALSATVVVICDQFEEFFINMPSVVGREPLLSFIAAGLNDPRKRVKVLFSIRQDFLYLMSSELEGWITEPLASRRLFHLRSFSQSQAVEVLIKSAAKAGLPLTEELSRRLAKELSRSGVVLPSELQIVGEQLQNRQIFTVDDYHRAGGKEQLVHGFLEDVIRLSGEPAAAALVLQALISEENTRRRLSRDEITQRTQLRTSQVNFLLTLLTQSRLVRETQEETPSRYELVHEYLIHRINEVTGQIMDTRQRANRLLRQYIANWQVDRHTRIPMGKIWFIRRHADMALGDFEHRLLQKSLWSGLWRAACLLMVFFILSLAAVAYFSVDERWDSIRLRDGHRAAVRQVVFSSDGKWLATCGEDGQVIVWDFARRQRQATLRDKEGWVTSVAFSPDGRYLASGGAGDEVVIWAVDRWQKAGSLKTDSSTYMSLSFSPNGRYLVASTYPRRSYVWQTGSWVKKWEYPFLFTTIAGNILFSPDRQKILLNNDDPTTGGRMLDLASGKIGTESNGPDKSFTGRAISPDGNNLIAIGTDGKLHVWDLPHRKRLTDFGGHQDFGRCVVYSPDGRIIASAAEDIALWDARDFTLHARLEHTAIVWSVAFSPDGQWLVSGHGDGSVLVWDVTGRKQAASLNDHCAPVRAVAFAPDGKRAASAGDDQTVAIWDLAQKRKSAVLIGHQNRVLSLAFSPDGRWVASGGWDGEVIVWDLARGCPKYRIKPSSQILIPIFGLAISPDNRWLASTVGVIELATGHRVISFYEQQIINNTYGFSFSPDGKRLAVVNPDRQFKVFAAPDWRTQEYFGSNQPDRMSFITVSYSPDGRCLVTGDDNGVVLLWETGPLRPVAQIGRHTARVKSIAFSPNGRWVASAGDDQVINLWDVTRRRLITRIDTHTAPVLALAFSPDGRQLISGEHDHSVRLHTLQRSLWGIQLDDIIPLSIR